MSDSDLPKLVRDKIPKIIRESGKDYVAHADNDPRVLVSWLSKKLHEELNEFRIAEEAEKLEEAADMFEVCRSLWSIAGLKLEDIIATADKKNLKRGSFKDGIILWEIVDIGSLKKL